MYTRASALKRFQARMKRDSGCKMYHGAFVTELAACWTLASCSKSRIDPDRLRHRRIGSGFCSPDSRLRGIPFARRGRGERRCGSDGGEPIALLGWARRIGGDGFRSSLFSAGSMDIGRILGAVFRAPPLITSRKLCSERRKFYVLR